MGCETEQNIAFLQKLLRVLGYKDVLDSKKKYFSPKSASFSEDAFVDAYYKCQTNAEGGMADDLSILEPHMAALVRTLNNFGLRTFFSCEGHLDRPRTSRHPMIGFNDEHSAKIAASLLNIAQRASGNKLKCVLDSSYLRIINTPISRNSERSLRNEKNLKKIWNVIIDIAEYIQTKNNKFHGIIVNLKEIID